MTLNILGLECSTEQGSVALSCHGQLTQQSWHGGRGHAEGILSQVSVLLEQQSLALSQLNAIAFSQGPGSFTGVRTACGMAQGLSLGSGVPVVPVPTLMVLAQGTNAERVVATLDARMGQIYLAAYERDRAGDWQTIINPMLCNPDQVPDLPGEGWVVAGSGTTLCEAVLAGRWQGKWRELVPELYPEARHLLGIAERWHAQGKSCLPEQAGPLYLRDKVALTVEERLNAAT
jgi:tRNA threonylcarbamoyladenosine biosynthesis protein TsaB